VIETKLEFAPTQNWQLAGLLIYRDDYNWLQIGRAFCTSNPAINCVNDGIYLDYYLNGKLVEPGGVKYAIGIDSPQQYVYLKIARQGQVYTGEMSLDGTTWIKVGEHTSAFQPTLIGLKASNQTQGVAQIPANFDYFTLLDYSPHTYIPLVIK
jgi:beta-xylosidase